MYLDVCMSARMDIVQICKPFGHKLEMYMLKNASNNLETKILLRTKNVLGKGHPFLSAHILTTV